MSTEQFDSHPVHSTLVDLIKVFSECEIKDAAPAIKNQFCRIDQFIGYSGVCLENTVPLLTPQNVLTQLNSHFGNMRKELAAFVSNNNTQHLTNAHAQIDGALNQIAALPTPRPKLSEKAFANSAVRFQKRSLDLAGSLEKKTDKCVTKIGALEKTSDEMDARFDFQKELLEQREAEIEETATALQEDYDDVKRDWQARIDELIVDQTEKFAELLKTKNAAHADVISKLDESSAKSLDYLSNKVEEASKLVGIIGNTGVTGNYKIVADKEGKAADKWRRYTMCLMLGIFGIVATIVFYVSEGLSWELGIFRLSAVLVLGVAAKYAAGQSQRHRIIETHNRKLELELTALGPFLEQLPDQKKNEVLATSAEKYFGAAPAEQISERPLADFTELLKNPKKAARSVKDLA